MNINATQTHHSPKQPTPKRKPFPTPPANPEPVELFDPDDLTKAGSQTVSERSKYDSFSIMNIRDGVAYYYTEEKYWHPDYRKAGVFSYLDCGEYRRLFKKSGMGVLVLKAPLSQSLGIEL